MAMPLEKSEMTPAKLCVMPLSRSFESETYNVDVLNYDMLLKFIQKRNLPHSSLSLTDKQIETLVLILRGLSNKEIARVLSISMNTVKDYVGGALRRLGCNTRNQLFAAYIAFVTAANMSDKMHKI